MKILKLRFKNINSLRGAYEIDFTTPSYARGGLFAIVGPTGSGKTSILDAVSFALFGVTPRTEGAVVAANEDEKKSVLITRGEKECEASVVFEVDGVYWLSRCRMRLVKSNGKSVELVRLSSPDDVEGEIVASKVRDWEQKISELLGMGFPAFTRTVLLAQGAFGRFLTAKPQERAEILERVTGSEIYARIGSTVYRRWSEADRAAADVQNQLELLELLSDEDRAKEEAVLRDYDSIVGTIRKEETRLRAVAAWHEARLRLEGREAELLALKGEAERECASVEAAERRQDASARAVKALSSLERRDAFREETERLEKGRLATQNDRDAAEKRLEAERLALPRANAEFEAAEARLEAFRPTVEAWREEKTRFETRRTSLEESEKHARTAATDAEGEKKKLAAAQKASAARREELGKLEAELSQSAALEAWREAAEGLRGAIDAWHRSEAEAKDAAERLRQASERSVLLEGEVQTAQRRLEDAECKRHAARERLLKAKDELAAAELGEGKDPIERMRLLTERIGAARRLLDLEEDAPLIAALDASARRKALEDLHDGRRTSIDADWPQLSECVRAEGPAALERLAKERETLLGDVRALEALRKTEVAARDEAGTAEVRWTKEKEALTSAQALLTEAGKGLEEARSLDAAKRLAVESARKDIETLSAPWQAMLGSQDPEGTLARLVARGNAREKKTRERDALRSAEESAAGFLAELAERVQKTQELAKRLVEEVKNGRRLYEEDFARWRASWEKAPPEAELRRLETERSARKAAAAGAAERVSAGEKTLKVLETRLEKEEKELLAQRDRLASAEEEWLRQKEKSGFASSKDLRLALLSEEDERKLHALLLKARERGVRIAHLSEETAKERLALHEMSGREDAASLSRDGALTSLDALREKEREVEERRGRSLEAIRADDARRERAKELRSEWKLREEERKRWLALNELIGDARGQRLRTIAQGITFRVLIEAANRVLRMMKSRYGLAAVGEPALEIAVIDHDMADTVRSSTNLSGGESFIVSLALALGLSNLSGSRLRVETLFLDEGFGTLDEATLHTALGVLDDLRRTTGRLIGVISHVAAVKERVETQIVVTPERGRGVGRIEGPGVRRLGA